MKILTASAMRWAEQAAVDAGETFEGLMETAGQKAAGILMEEVPLPNGPVLILCGKGNNGGDGLVIARALAQKGIPVQVVFLLGRKLSPLAEKNLGRLQGLPAEILDAASIAPEERDALCKNAGLIVDGVFGTGFSGDLPENVRAWTAAANQSKAVRAALDIPSGLNCDTGLFGKDAFAADITVTFAAHKPAHFLKGSRGLCGRVFCADIGIRQEILAAAPGHITLLDGDEAKKGIPRRKEDSNKGDYGKLLAVGGCTHMTGAILMASLAALHCGVGLLKAAVPEPVCPLIAARMPEVIYLPVIPAKSGVLPASCGEALLKETEWADGVLLGCGMSVCEDTVSLTRKLLSCGKSMVIDADGLNCVAQDVNILKSRKAPTILTPHIKEFSRLTGTAIRGDAGVKGFQYGGCRPGRAALDERKRQLRYGKGRQRRCFGRDHRFLLGPRNPAGAGGHGRGVPPRGGWRRGCGGFDALLHDCQQNGGLFSQSFRQMGGPLRNRERHSKTRAFLGAGFAVPLF